MKVARTLSAYSYIMVTPCVKMQVEGGVLDPGSGGWNSGQPERWPTPAIG